MSYAAFELEKANMLSAPYAPLFAHPAACPPSAARVILSRHILAFTIYPRSEQDVRTNELLWHAVRSASFAPAHLAAVLPDGVMPFALALPAELSAFLSAVSLDEMHRSVLYMLADAAQGEDEAGLRNMHNDLAPRIWRSLEQLMASSVGAASAAEYELRGGAAAHCISYASFMLDEALQSAQAHDYWKIEVELALFVPDVPSSATPFALHIPDDHAHADVRKRAEVMSSLYCDWRRYATHCLCWQPEPRARAAPPPAQRAQSRNRALKRTRESRERARRRAVRDMLEGLVASRRQPEMWERVTTLLAAAARPGCALGALPQQVLAQHVLPRVVLEDAGTRAFEAAGAPGPPQPPVDRQGCCGGHTVAGGCTDGCQGSGASEGTDGSVRFSPTAAEVG